MKAFLMVLLAASAALAVPPTAAQEAELAFTYRVEDPSGDGDDGNGNLCGAVFAGAGPCDVLLLEAGTTPTEFLFRWTVSSLDFGATGSATSVNYRLRLVAPDGTALRAYAHVTATGTAAPPSFNGDPPAAAGTEVEVDRAAKTVLLRIPLESLGNPKPGDPLEFTTTATQYNLNGGVATNGLYSTADSVTAPPFVFAEPEPVGEDVLRLVEYYNVTEMELTVVRSLENAMQTEVYNWTSPLTAAVLNYTAEFEGGANVTVVDGANATMYEGALVNGSFEVPLESAEPGNWTVRLDYHNYTGELNLSIRAPPAVPGVSPSPSRADGGTGDDEGEDPQDNGTAGLDDTGDGSKDKGSPAPALPLLAGLLALAVAVRRRRD